MAYGKHYIIQALSKNAKLYTLEIWEDGYSGAEEQIPAGYSPFIQNLLAQSDDPFEPILASSLQITGNITDYTGSLPDLTSTDDRKYWVKLKCGPNPASDKAYLALRNHQGGIGIRKSTLVVLVNGVQQLTLSGSGTTDGQLVVNAGDIVTIQQSLIGGATMGSTWGMDIDDTTTTLFSDSTSTPDYPTSFEYSFMAAAGTTYRAKTYVAGTVDYPDVPEFDLWQGFIMTDNAQVPFYSGYKSLSVTCTDGLAMLKNIEYAPTNPDINVTETLKNVILNCLNAIGWPEGFYLNICLSIYAGTMLSRGDGSQYEPFGQAYYAPRNWLNNPVIPLAGVESTNVYISCYDVLTKVLSSFGCRIEQSESEWVITSINEQAGALIYFTKVDETGAVINSGQKNINRTVVPYSDSAEVYFINADQSKIVRKGFPDVQIKCPASYASQCVDNGDMAEIATAFPRNWSSSAGVGSVTLTSLGPFNAINIAPTGGGPTQRTPSAAPLSAAKAYIGDRISLSFWIDGQTTPSPTKPKVYLQILLVVPITLDTYWLDETNNWQHQVGPDPIPDTRYYPVIGNTSAAYENISIQTPPVPVSGGIFLKWVTDNFDTFTCTIANVNMTFVSPYQYRLVRYTVTNPSYQKTIELPLGGPADANSYSQTGSIVDSAGSVLTGWYRYGVVESYNDLTRLVFQQIFNVISKASINLQGNIRKLFSTVDSETVPTAPFIALQVQDTTDQLSVDGKYYQLGNTQINHTDDELSATLLEISNTDIGDPDLIRDREIPKNQV